MKKALLDYCFTEVKGLQLEYIDQSEIIIQKIKQTMIDKGARYPKDGPHMTQAESVKMKKLIYDYKTIRLDAFVTNAILGELAKFDIINAIRIIRFNFDRLGGF